MDGEASYLVDAAAYMLVFWNPASQKRLTVKEAMQNVGFSANAIATQKTQVRVRRRFKELCNNQISVDCSRSWPFVTMIKALVVVWLLSRRPPKPPKTRKQRQQKPQ
jgi:hypothetical protein